MIAKHIVAAIMYTSMIIIIFSIYKIDHSMAASPLSTTLQSLLQLSVQFFVVHALHWLFAATRAFLFKANWTLIMESTVLAAKTSVQYNPILAILFISCRM